MKKIYTGTMRCAICRRAMAKAAALQNGLPVGPTCAANAGLLPGRDRRQGRLDLVVTETTTPDTQTIPLFET